MRTAFCFNLDGTITTTEVIPCIASKIGLSNETAILTHAALDGKIPFDSCFKVICLLLGQIPTGKVQEIVATIPLDKNIISFIHSHRPDSFLVTEVLDLWVHPISRFCGCECFSSKSAIHGGKLTLTKLVNKAEAVFEIRARGYERIVAIGNSTIDDPMLRAADIAIAFGGILELSSAIISASDYIIHEGAALCRMLQAL